MRFRSAEQLFGQRVPIETSVPGHFAEYRRKRTNAKLRVRGDGDVMFAVLLRSQAQMAARLASDRVAHHTKRACNVVAREVPR